MQVMKGRICMRDLNGNNYGSITDNSTTIISKIEGEQINHTPIEKEETSIKKLLFQKFIDVFWGAIFSFIAFICKHLSVKGSEFKNIILIVIFICCIACAIICFLCFILNLLKIIQLQQKGRFVEFESKEKFVWSLQKPENKSVIRNTGKVYKNIDGTIYSIKSKKCPFCESEPIGRMKLNYDSHNYKYLWVCSEQPSHAIEFDYKKKF